MINICIAGATGWAGRALVTAVLDADDMTLRSAVSRSGAGADLGSALGREALGIPVFATVAEALDGVDVLIDYTSHETVKANALTAIGHEKRHRVAPCGSAEATPIAVEMTNSYTSHGAGPALGAL